MMHLRPLPAASLAYWTIRSGVLCADTIVNSNGTPNWFRIWAAAAIVGRSESDPMMIPTSGFLLESDLLGLGAGVYLFGSGEESGRERRKMGRMLERSSSSESAVMVMWPILRPFLHSAFP